MDAITSSWRRLGRAASYVRYLMKHRAKSRVPCAPVLHPGWAAQLRLPETTAGVYESAMFHILIYHLKQ